jgi:hypothetical protein
MMFYAQAGDRWSAILMISLIFAFENTNRLKIVEALFFRSKFLVKTALKIIFLLLDGHCSQFEENLMCSYLF